jgi:hypothetical protein
VMIFPFARASLQRCTPALTRSVIRLRSNYAKTPHMPNSALPAGVWVSIAC